MCSIFLPLWLSLAPPADRPNATLTQLEQVTVAAEPSSASQTELEAALREAEAQALELGGDPKALEILAQARLALVWVYLAQGQSEAAEAAMDEAIRSAMGMAIPAGNFGPQVLELHDQRKSALEQVGTASIEIDCDSCEVIINERRSPNPSEPLQLGLYRVWVTSRDGALQPARFDVELTEPGAVETREFRAVQAPAPTSELPPLPAHDGPNDKPRRRMSEGRMLPRWAELLGAAAGIGLLVSGGVLSSLHGRCRGDAKDGDPNDLDTCPVLFNNHPQDYALFGLGGSLLALSGVVLTIDEVRLGRARGRQAMVTWTIRF